MRPFTGRKNTALSAIGRHGQNAFETLEHRLLFSTVNSYIHTWKALGPIGSSSPALTGDLAIFLEGAEGADSASPSSRVDVFDDITGRWSVANLSVPRGNVAALGDGGLAMFAGGYTGTATDSFSDSDVIDVYDSQTGRWSVAHLSQARESIPALLYVDIPVFAGGTIRQLGGVETYSNVVDMYDPSTGQWTATTLPEAVPDLQAVGRTVMDQIVFVSGEEGKIFLYNIDTGQWVVQPLSQARSNPAVACDGQNIVVAGGLLPDGTASNVIDIYNIYTGLTTETLPHGEAGLNATFGNSGGLYLAGGYQQASNGTLEPSNNLTILQLGTGQLTSISLPGTGYDLKTTTILNDLFVAGLSNADYPDGKLVDVIDTDTNQQTTAGLLSGGTPAAVTAVGSTVIITTTLPPSGGGADLFTLDYIPPTATLISAPTLQRSLHDYTFKVSYYDSQRVDESSIGNGDVLVTGPGGFSQPAQLISVARGKHASTLIASYSVRGPDGQWSSSANGAYYLTLQSGAVSDTNGNKISESLLGQFEVAVPGAATSAIVSQPVTASLINTETDQVQGSWLDDPPFRI